MSDQPDQPDQPGLLTSADLELISPEAAQLVKECLADPNCYDVFTNCSADTCRQVLQFASKFNLQQVMYQVCADLIVKQHRDDNHTLDKMHSLGMPLLGRQQLHQNIPGVAQACMLFRAQNGSPDELRSLVEQLHSCILPPDRFTTRFFDPGSPAGELSRQFSYYSDFRFDVRPATHSKFISAKTQGVFDDKDYRLDFNISNHQITLLDKHNNTTHVVSDDYVFIEDCLSEYGNDHELTMCSSVRYKSWIIYYCMAGMCLVDTRHPELAQTTQHILMQPGDIFIGICQTDKAGTQLVFSNCVGGDAAELTVIMYDLECCSITKHDVLYSFIGKRYLKNTFVPSKAIHCNWLFDNYVVFVGKHGDDHAKVYFWHVDQIFSHGVGFDQSGQPDQSGQSDQPDQSDQSGQPVQLVLACKMQSSWLCVLNNKLILQVWYGDKETFFELDCKAKTATRLDDEPEPDEVADMLAMPELDALLDKMVASGLCRVSIDFPDAVRACQVFKLVEHEDLALQRQVVQHLNDFVRMDTYDHSNYQSPWLAICQEASGLDHGCLPGVFALDQMCLVYSIVENEYDQFVLQITDMYADQVISTSPTKLPDSTDLKFFTYQQPQKPEQPDQPEQPEQPDQPDQPDQPEQPEQPQQPNLSTYNFHCMIVCTRAKCHHVELWSNRVRLEASSVEQQHKVINLTNCKFEQHDRFVLARQKAANKSFLVDLVTKNSFEMPDAVTVVSWDDDILVMQSSNSKFKLITASQTLDTILE